MSENKFYPTIGLEIHAELDTESKMFCQSKNDPDEITPNVNICPVCMAHPGTLPVCNQKAIEHMIRIGLSVDGTIANFTEFDRKNYFYPDIPKGYQISQYKYPIVSGGNLAGFAITRIHLEEDTGANKHIEGNSLVDFNRAGVPLMELVTEPVLHSAEDAVIFAKELQILLRFLGVSKANMEKGEMRVEANISISDDPDKLGTKVEVKNLNSFSVAFKAIEFEIERMKSLHMAGRAEEIVQETRGWDEVKQRTFSQRKKENSEEYRYFPEPDIPKFYLHDIFDLESLKEDLPELPWEKRSRYKIDFGIKDEDIESYIYNTELGVFFENVSILLNGNKEQIILASNYITSDIVGIMKSSNHEDVLEKISVENFAKLIRMVSNGDLGSRGAKEIIPIFIEKGGDPEQIANEQGLIQKSDPEELKNIIKKIILDNAKSADDYRAGKEVALKFLVGQVMRETKGSANPKVAEDLLRELLQ